MATIKKTIILNTLADNAADFYVDATGLVQITGVTDQNQAPLATKTKVVRQDAVAEVLGVSTATIGTATVGVEYKISLQGNSAAGGGAVNTTYVDYSYTAVTGDDVTAIAVALKNAINANVTNSKVTATNASGVLTLTAITGYPCINLVNTKANALMTIANPTAGVNAVGAGTALASDPNYITDDTHGTFTAGATYTRLDVYFTQDNDVTMPSSKTTSQNLYSVFINNVPTSNGTSNLAAVNLAAILSTSYGTATLLQAGYRAIVTTATPTITIASNLATLGGTGNSVITAGIMPNDWVIADPIIAGTASAGKALALGAGSTAGTWDATKFYVSAGSATAKTFTLVQVRNLPR